VLFGKASCPLLERELKLTGSSSTADALAAKRGASPVPPPRRRGSRQRRRSRSVPQAPAHGILCARLGEHGGPSLLRGIPADPRGVGSYRQGGLTDGGRAEHTMAMVTVGIVKMAPLKPTKGDTGLPERLTRTVLLGAWTNSHPDHSSINQGNRH